MKTLTIFGILSFLALQAKANKCFDPCNYKTFGRGGEVLYKAALVDKKYPMTNYHCILKCAMAMTKETTLSNDVLLDSLDYCNRLWKAMWNEVNCDDAIKDFVRETFVSNFSINYVQ